jgi:hypothetical protein
MFVKSLLISKLKLIGNDEFNHLIIFQHFLSLVESNFSLMSDAQHMEYLIEMGVNDGDKVRT